MYTYIGYAKHAALNLYSQDKWRITNKFRMTRQTDSHKETRTLNYDEKKRGGNPNEGHIIVNQGEDDPKQDSQFPLGPSGSIHFARL